MPSACVTGGNGFLASALIRQLLEKGYAVNATVRDPGNEQKAGQLKQMQSLGTLTIFRADLEEEGSFDEAFNGCDYVFLVAAPVKIMSENPEEELIKPAIKGVLNMFKSCVKTKATLKRVILTSSAAAVSINQLEGVNLVMDEEAWSDLTFLTTTKPRTWGYAVSKVLAEKEAIKYAEENELSLVRVIPSLIVGPAVGSVLANSTQLSLCLLSGNEGMIRGFRQMQCLSGSISMVHVEDLCRAHIFVAEEKVAAGRYICSAVNTSLPELACFLRMRYPQRRLTTDCSDLPEKSKVILSSEKLIKAGFEFKYSKLEDIYDETIRSAEAVGFLTPTANGSTHVQIGE
ncbi:anthocyanidin reductase ((2S)-flavan-3-ol-forming)-like [Zingiber officinale]|uniref:anthocyanidin reductase ((2S)-flavan-3-ol-forming)-like n=1 Tax=Zingiber officinale TaxID=94328 RepID=UPI001C4D983E|nr:anthocyanidin reductase ((2S)-flavan-3-ol-forming)-like [Zingiber officinale]